LKNKITNIIILFLIVFTIGNLFHIDYISCQTESCSITSNFIIFKKSYLEIIAIFLFSSLLILNIYKYSKIFKFILYSFILSETVLFSYLYFHTGTICLECLTVFSGLIILSLINLNKIYTILNIILIILSFNIISPQHKIYSNLILLTKKDCKHCLKVKNYIKENNIQNIKIDSYKNYSELFHILNIKQVPVLIKNKKEIFIGEKEILNEIKVNENFHFKENFDFLNNEEDFGCQIEKPTCN